MASASPWMRFDVTAGHALGVGEAVGLGHPHPVDVKFPPARPPLGADPVGRHCSHPFGLHARSRMMLRTTPGETSRWRGTAVVCLPQGQPHLVCLPSSLSTWQPCARSALSTLRRLISLTTRVKSSGARCQAKWGLDVPAQAQPTRPMGWHRGRRRDGYLRPAGGRITQQRATLVRWAAVEAAQKNPPR